MAVYAYACHDCRTVFDVSRSIHEESPAVVVCPECWSEDTVKTFSAPGLVFKGGGWGKSSPKAPSFDIEDRR